MLLINGEIVKKRVHEPERELKRPFQFASGLILPKNCYLNSTFNELDLNFIYQIIHIQSEKERVAIRHGRLNQSKKSILFLSHNIHLHLNPIKNKPQFEKFLIHLQLLEDLICSISFQEIASPTILQLTKKILEMWSKDLHTVFKLYENLKNQRMDIEACKAQHSRQLIANQWMQFLFKTW